MIVMESTYAVYEMLWNRSFLWWLYISGDDGLVTKSCLIILSMPAFVMTKTFCDYRVWLLLTTSRHKLWSFLTIWLIVTNTLVTMIDCSSQNGFSHGLSWTRLWWWSNHQERILWQTSYFLWRILVVTKYPFFCSVTIFT